MRVCLLLLFPLVLPLCRPQTPAPPATVGDQLEESRNEVLARRQSWRNAHTALTEAVRKPEACQPEFTASVGEAKSAADAWLSSTERAFDLWAARRLAAAKPVSPPQLVEKEETDALLSLLQTESAAFARRRLQLGNTLVLERTSQKTGSTLLRAYEELVTVTRALASFKAVDPQTKSQEEVVQSLLRSLQGSRSADSARFQAIYDSLESEVKRKCDAETSIGSADPFSSPSAVSKQGNRGKASTRREQP